MGQVAHNRSDCCVLAVLLLAVCGPTRVHTYRYKITTWQIFYNRVVDLQSEGGPYRIIMEGEGTHSAQRTGDGALALSKGLWTLSTTYSDLAWLILRQHFDSTPLALQRAKMSRERVTRHDS